MDSITLLKTLNRLCLSYPTCVGCPVCKTFQSCPVNVAPYRQDPNKYYAIIKVVDEWRHEHPPKCRGELFLERNPDAAKNVLGMPLVRPCDYLGDEITLEQCEVMDNCAECVEKFWKEPVE